MEKPHIVHLRFLFLQKYMETEAKCAFSISMRPGCFRIEQ